VHVKNLQDPIVADSRDSLVGIMEMGGASTQLAFTPEGDILADLFPVLLAGDRYHVYVHSYLTYGKDEVFARVNNRLVANDTDNDSSQPVNNPCMFPGQRFD